MTMPVLLSCLALLGSVVLALRHRPVLFPVIALVVSGLEVLRAFGLAHISIARFPLALIFGATLVVAGVAVYLRTSLKSAIAGATTVTLVGALQVLSALKLLS